MSLINQKNIQIGIKIKQIGIKYNFSFHSLKYEPDILFLRLSVLFVHSKIDMQRTKNACATIHNNEGKKIEDNTIGHNLCFMM